MAWTRQTREYQNRGSPKPKQADGPAVHRQVRDAQAGDLEAAGEARDLEHQRVAVVTDREPQAAPVQVISAADESTVARYGQNDKASPS